MLSNLIDFVNNLRSNPKANNKTQEETEWAIIHEHSLAKINKSLAEQYYAPKPLPPQLNQSLNERIESSRNQLMKLLREQNDKSFVI